MGVLPASHDLLPRLRSGLGRFCAAFILTLALLPWCRALSAQAGSTADGAPTWVAEPSLRIGVALGDPDYELGRQVHAARSPDGTIAVGELDAKEIRFFGPDGQIAARQGREGEGPGEYRYVRFLLTCGGDRFWVYDTDLRRTTIVSSDGELLDIFSGPSPDGTGGPYDLRCDREGRFIASTWARGEREAMMNGESGPFRGTQLVVLMDVRGGVRDTIGVFPSGERYLTRRPDGSPAGSHPRFFGPTTHVAIGGGRAFVGDAARPAVMVYEGDGLDTLSLPLETTAVTDEDVDRFVDEQMADVTDPNQARRQRASWADYDFPSEFPYYSDLRADATGLLWVRQHPRPGATTVPWLVVHPEGGVVARVVLPVSLRVTQIGRDRILGVLTEDGVNYVQEYSLHR